MSSYVLPLTPCRTAARQCPDKKGLCLFLKPRPAEQLLISSYFFEFPIVAGKALCLSRVQKELYNLRT